MTDSCGIRNFFLEKSILINCQDSKLSAFIGDLGGIRTRDPLIKSQMLYQLSYEVTLWRKGACYQVFSPSATIPF